MAMPPEDDEVKALPDSPGKDVVVKVCITCHAAASFRKFRLTEDGWWAKVSEMVEFGAKADDKQQEAIVGYLATNFGKDAKVNVNTAPQSEFIVVLRIPSADSQKIVDYRADHGNFHEWRDLLKVPGVDAAKVEAAKDKMAF